VKKTPESIQKYLATLEGNQRADGYLCLNKSDEVIENGGWVGTTDLSSIDTSKPLVESIPILEGLLPGNSKTKTVINHAHVDKDYYFDIHLFHDYVGAWVLFIDKTRSAKLLQQEQQIRLTDDFINAKRNSEG